MFLNGRRTLNNEELEVIKRDLLAFVHRVSAVTSEKSDAEVSVLPAVAELLINNTGVIRLQGEELETVINTLYQADYEMTTDNGLIVTDLPEAENETTWQLDYTKTLKAINEAVCILDTSVYNRKDNCPECTS